jgi:hypothetical protein
VGPLTGGRNAARCQRHAKPSQAKPSQAKPHTRAHACAGPLILPWYEQLKFFFSLVHIKVAHRPNPAIHPPPCVIDPTSPLLLLRPPLRCSSRGNACAPSRLPPY